MNADQFESELQRRRIRPIPEAWRDEILQAAAAHELAADGTRGLASGRARGRVADLMSWLWPKPAAWAALTAIWVILAVLNLAISRPDSELTPKLESDRGIPQGAFAERQSILLEILNVPPAAADPAAKPNRSTPRTDTRGTQVLV